MGQWSHPLDLVEAVKRRGPLTDATLRQRVAQIYVEHTVLELIRMRTLSARLKGAQPGAEASIRKLLGDEHGQHVMALARDLIGAAALLAGDATPGTETKDLAPQRPPADLDHPAW